MKQIQGLGSVSERWRSQLSKLGKYVTSEGFADDRNSKAF